jgi:hypothetical protein
MDKKKVIAVAVSLGLLAWISKGYFKKLKAEKSREALLEMATAPSIVYNPEWIHAPSPDIPLLLVT